MSEINSNANVETKVRKGRGINNETRSVSNLKFSEKDINAFGLFNAYIEGVEVKYSTYGEEAGAFAGQAVPRLTIHFTSMHEDVKTRRHIYQTFNPVESSVDTCEGGKAAWRVDATLGWIKHILEVMYLGNRQFNDAECDALLLDYVDFDDETNTYIPVETEDVLKAWGKLFTNVASMLNGTFNNGTTEPSGKPCYADANGKPYPLFIKLIRSYKVKNEWKNISNNGDLGFPTFVGEGCIEKIKGANAKPEIVRFNAITESLAAHEVKKPVAPSMPGNIPGAIPGMAGVNIAGVSADPNAGAYAATVSDMPF